MNFLEWCQVHEVMSEDQAESIIQLEAADELCALMNVYVEEREVIYPWRGCWSDVKKTDVSVEIILVYVLESLRACVMDSMVGFYLDGYEHGHVDTRESNISLVGAAEWACEKLKARRL